MTQEAYLEFMAELELEDQKIDRATKKEIQEKSEALSLNYRNA